MVVITEGDALEPAFDVLVPVGFEVEDLGGGLAGLVRVAGGRAFVVTESETGVGFLLGVYTEQGWAEGEQGLEYHDELDADGLVDVLGALDEAAAR